MRGNAQTELPDLMQSEDPTPNECPVNCPNRKSAAENVRRSSWVLTIAATLFLGFYCWSSDRRGQELNPSVFIPTFVFIGLGVGVNIEPSEIANFISGGRG